VHDDPIAGVDKEKLKMKGSDAWDSNNYFLLLNSLRLLQGREDVGLRVGLSVGRETGTVS
jgi:hypothetical protein